VVQGGVRDERQVVQLQDVQVFGGARAGGELTDALVRDLEPI
jgi:hypothetical protein